MNAFVEAVSTCFGLGAIFLTGYVLVLWIRKKDSLKKWLRIYKWFWVAFFVYAMIMGNLQPAESEPTKDVTTSAPTTSAPKPTTAATEAPTTSAPTEAPTEARSELYVALWKLGYSEEHCAEIEAVLNEVGINSIEVNNMTGEAESGLNRVNMFPNGMEQAGGFTTEDGKLFYIEFNGEPVYDSENGGKLKSIDEVHIAETEVDSYAAAQLHIAAEEVLNHFLTYPAEADFHTFDWREAREDDNYVVSGSVTAKNALGVKIKMPFTVWFINNSGKLSVEGVELNGERVK